MEVGVHGLKVKLHHNPKGATEHSCLMAKHLTKELYDK